MSAVRSLHLVGRRDKKTLGAVPLSERVAEGAHYLILPLGEIGHV